MAAVLKILMPLLFASTLADLGEKITGISASPLACDAAQNATECLLEPSGKWDAGAAEEKQAAEEAKAAAELKTAGRLAKEMLRLLEFKLKDGSGLIFLYILLGCCAAICCALLGGQLRQNLFGSGPVSVSSTASEEAGRPPSDALLIDDQGRVLAARSAELSVPLDHALALTAKQREGISRVRFTCLQEGEKQSFSISGDVVERTWDSGRLTLQLASGRVLCIESSGTSSLLNADGSKQRPVTEGVLSITQFHVRDLAELKRRAAHSSSRQEVEL